MSVKDEIKKLLDRCTKDGVTPSPAQIVFELSQQGFELTEGHARRTKLEWTRERAFGDTKPRPLAR